MSLTNNDFLTSTGFKVVVGGGSTFEPFEFYITNFNTPTVSIPAAAQATPKATAWEPGDKVEFDPINMQVLLDADLNVLNNIYSWMIRTVESNKESGDQQVDVAVIVRNKIGNSTRKFIFKNCFPIDMGSLPFNSQDESETLVMLDVVFRFDYFEIGTI